MKFSRYSIIATLLLAGLAQASRADDTGYQSLLRRLPDSTNAIVLIDVPALRKALGVSEGDSLMATGISGIPVMASKFVMGAQVDVSQRSLTAAVGLIQLDRAMTIKDVAKAENSPVQQIQGISVVGSPRNVYFVDVAPKLLGAYTPASWKQLSRWLAFEKTNQLDLLSAYLIKAASSSNSTIITAAIDLENSLDPAAIRRSLDNSQVLATKPNVDFGAMAQTIAQIKGMVFKIEPGSPLTGDLTVDFGTDLGQINYYPKELLLETLRNVGLYVQDMDSWESVSSEQSIHIRGPLSFHGLRKFGKLIRTPAPDPNAGLEAYQNASPAQRALMSSQRYFKSVNQILSDLREDKTRRFWTMANWYDQAAQQIDQLPILDVAPALLRWGNATGKYLLRAGTGLSGLSEKIGYVRHNAYYGYSGLGIYGAGGSVSTVKQVVDALEAEWAETSPKIWERIDNATDQVRNQMTQKFNTQF